METRIKILNVLKYEKDGQVHTRLGFILDGKETIRDSEKFKGYPELANFYDGTVFDKIPVTTIGETVMAKFKNIQDVRNPMSVRQIVEAIKVNGSYINLL